MEEKLKKLAVALLDDGINEAAYMALLDVMPQHLALYINDKVDATDGRFYLPKDTKLEWPANPEDSYIRHLNDGGAIAHEGDGRIVRYDVHGNTEEVREVDDTDWQEWADLFGLKREDFDQDEEEDEVI